MNRCASCRFYYVNRTDDAQNDYDETVYCSNEKFVLTYHVDLHDIDEDGVQVESDEGWGFRPNPKFGCIHHEPVLARKEGEG